MLRGQCGYYHDFQGRYLLGHRYYDSYTGRFVTRDPIGYKGGINLYGFVGNNPVNRRDPNGTSDSDSFDPFAYFNTLFSHATMHDVLHAAKHNDVVHAVGVLFTDLSYVPLPENPAFDAKAATVAVEVGAPVARAASEVAFHSFSIVEREGNLIIADAVGPHGAFAFVAEHVREGNTLILKGFDIQGPGGVKIKLGREGLNAFAQAYGRSQGVKRLIIEGAKRSTGRNIGRVPTPKGFEIK